MDRRELDIIKELMGKLEDEMQYGEEDFSERLGRPKASIKIEIGKKSLGDDMDESMDSEEGMSHGMDHEMSPLDEEEDYLSASKSPEESLKKRLLKLRGM